MYHKSTVHMGTVTSRAPGTPKPLNVTDILNEKEFIFLVLQTEIDANIKIKNRRELYHIEKEIHGHIRELKTILKLKNNEKDILERIQRLTYNYEISLAKVRSIFNNSSEKIVVKEGNETVDESKVVIAPTTENTDDISSPETSISQKNDSGKTSPQAEDGHDNTSNLIAFLDEDIDDEPTYANVEFDSDKSEETSLTKSEGFGPVKKKPPVPVPRNKQEILVKEVPNYFMRLNEILGKGTVDRGDLEEVLSIRRKTDEIKNIFMDKMNEIFKLYEENTSEVKEEDKI